jgi:TusA-related sulfurtransferase
MNRLVLALLLSLFALPVFAQQAKPDDTMKDCPMHDQHAAHHATVERNGDQAMGFPHDKTSHHFRISSDGGTIEVTANDSSDKTDIGAIRSHLSHIAAMFNNGDFSTPMFVHDGAPPGVTTMKLMKSAIRYAYEEIPSGGRIQVKSDDPVGVASIHDFLRFQIADHQTGDSLEVGQK